MNKTFTKLFISLSLMAATAVHAQEVTDTLPATVAKLAGDVDILKRIKITGYLQAQFQYADSSGMASFGGGNFPALTDKRIALRRGRLKATYTSADALSQAVIQFDVTEKGMTIKDAYFKFTDPWTHWFSLQAGVQNRPFGFEIPYSSSSRETPERGRMSQIIFPNERDLGGMLVVQGPKGSNWDWLKLEAGMFNGTGSPGTSAQYFPASSPSPSFSGINTSDFDKYKDFIGHLSVSRATLNQAIKYGGGVSYYNGGFRSDNDTAYAPGNDANGVNGFIINEKTIKRTEVKRQYIGVDAQVSVEWAAGITTLRGEYIQGDQPNASGTTVSPASPVSGNIYKRKFNGAYFYFVHNIAATPLQVVAKYDWYDPNTDAKGDEIGKAVASPTKPFSATDLRYDTFGFGLTWLWDANVKISAYYDMVKNETTDNITVKNADGDDIHIYSKDFKDNLFTLRIQYKF